MSGITSDKTLTIFASAPKHIIEVDDKHSLVVNIKECFITKTQFIEYVFHREKDFKNFIEKSKWNELPMVHKCGTRVFSDYINGKFVYLN